MLLFTDGEPVHPLVWDINRDDDVGVVLFLQVVSLCVHLLVLYKLTGAPGEKLVLG